MKQGRFLVEIGSEIQRFRSQNRFLGALPYHVPERAFDGADAVIHLANTTGGESESTAYAVNVEGTRRVLELASKFNIRKIIYVSSQSSKGNAISAYGKTKFESENILLSGNLPVTILRPGLVYGLGERDLFSRMARTVRKLPVIPLIGGGRALVQAIHVEDLAEALLRCLQLDVGDNRIFSVGDPKPIPLSLFLQKIAKTQTGRAKPAIWIPIAPLLWIAERFESLGISFPINTNNLKGLKVVESMSTREDLAALGLRLRPLAKSLREIEQKRSTQLLSSQKPVNKNQRSLAVALIGAGRIGLMHAVTLERQLGMRLAAIVDRNPKAISFFRGLGIRAPSYHSIQKALSHTEIDAAIIATPPTSHLPLLRRCARKNLPALIEKPMARSMREMDFFDAISARCLAHVGYLPPSYPHMREALARLHKREFGNVIRFEAYSLQSLFPGSKRWETQPKISGGGVLINLGGHILSLIEAAFGSPRSIQAQHKNILNHDVEDAIVIHFTYQGFTGSYVSSWAIDGFAQAENRLVIFTDQGRLVFTNTIVAFWDHNGNCSWFAHQLDYAIGFNFAPDYIGAGVTSELLQLQALARDRQDPRMPLRRAVKLERLLFSIYEKSQKTECFRPFQKKIHVDTKRGKRKIEEFKPFVRSAIHGNAIKYILDIREISSDFLSLSLLRDLKKRWDAFQVLANQIRPLRSAGISDESISVVVPDFMNYARLLNIGQPWKFFKQIGLRSTFPLGVRAIQSVVSDLGVTFWAVVNALLAADLAQIPSDFRGALLIHSFPTDLVVALSLPGRLETWIQQAKRRAKLARVGAQTRIARDAFNTLVYLNQPLDFIHFLSSPGSSDLKDLLNHIRSSACFGDLSLVAEVGPAPGDIHRKALRDAASWSQGANALVVDAVCDDALADIRRRALSKSWRRAFPGLCCPETIF